MPEVLAWDDQCESSQYGSRHRTIIFRQPGESPFLELDYKPPRRQTHSFTAVPTRLESIRSRSISCCKQGCETQILHVGWRHWVSEATVELNMEIGIHQGRACE